VIPTAILQLSFAQMVLHLQVEHGLLGFGATLHTEKSPMERPGNSLPRLLATYRYSHYMEQ
jgi:hypothetical protein